MEPEVHFRLYVAGRSPNSRLAVANLTALCETYFPGRNETEIVDVFQHPERALEDGIYLTPQLVILSPLPVQSIVGNLNHTEVILQLLNHSGNTP